MPLPLPFEYKSSGFSEPGIFVELYLPKRARFQDILYKTLTEGFNFDLVRRHFMNRRKRPLIKKVLEHHSQWKKYSSKSILEMEPFYWGYSLYEVDGVFFSKRARRGKKRQIIEERTQVIRMMFLPDLDSVAGKLRPRMDRKTVADIAKIYLRTSGHKRGARGASVVSTSIVERMMEQGDPKLLRHLKNGGVENLLNYVETWFDDVGLFIFGYVIFQICSEIKKLGDVKEVEYEDELWVTSFWNLNVNRVSYLKQRPRQERKK